MKRGQSVGVGYFKQGAQGGAQSLKNGGRGAASGAANGNNGLDLGNRQTIGRSFDNFLANQNQNAVVQNQ